MIRVQINSGSFNKQLGALLSRTKNPTGMLKVAGRELANQLKKWFRGKDSSSANKLSERRSHFWLAVANSVQNPEQTGFNAISVSVNHSALAQKVFGGTITAKRSRALTIPVEERAYGRTAATFEHETGLKLFLLRSGKGNFQNAVLAVKEGKGFQVEYILTRSVTQSADQTALPPKGELEKAILARGQSFLENEAKQL